MQFFYGSRGNWTTNIQSNWEWVMLVIEPSMKSGLRLPMAFFIVKYVALRNISYRSFQINFCRNVRRNQGKLSTKELPNSKRPPSISRYYRLNSFLLKMPKIKICLSFNPKIVRNHHHPLDREINSENAHFFVKKRGMLRRLIYFRIFCIVKKRYLVWMLSRCSFIIECHF